ncbi:P-loop ATPase, Sll1717 family [Microbacteriaceae bacterium 4G12]
MAFISFVERRGFIGDPFASTNSETEDRLSDYFVPPPYFDSVMGTPTSPKSSVVFAPRGSGKTAQRRMIEQESAVPGAQFLCITYAEFNGMNHRTVTLDDHKTQVCRLLTIAILAWLEDESIEALWMDAHQKQVLKYCAERFLSNLNQSEYEAAISAVKTLGDKASKLWRKYGGVVAVAVSALLAKVGAADVTIPVTLREQQNGKETPVSYLYEQLVAIALSIGWKAVYVLIDKVDEAETSIGNATAAHQLIAPLVTDLPTLELPGVGFKFFLWDQTEAAFAEGGGRPDRLGVSNLRWTVEELSDMLKKRMGAFSDGVITSFNDLIDPSSKLDVHLLLAYLSHGSPRDMIRMAEEIISEHTRTSGSADEISEITVFKGVLAFSKRRSTELFPQYMTDLARIPEPTFTINKLASDVFRVETQSARSKIQKWMAAGAVEKVGDEPNPGNRPRYLYAFKDLRIALATSNLASIPLFLDNYSLECPSCSALLITSLSRANCTSCGTTVSIAHARSLLKICTRA